MSKCDARHIFSATFPTSSTFITMRSISTKQNTTVTRATFPILWFKKVFYERGKSMHTHRFQRYLLSLLGCCFVVLLAACGPHPASSLNANQLATSASQAQVSRATVAMPPTQTSCPPQGQGRPAVTAPLTLGSHQNIVYVYNTSTAGILRRYDVSTGQKTTIVSLSNVAISDAQVSTDGQYVLFLSKVSGQPAIQMVRMDGQGLQTLYCG